MNETNEAELKPVRAWAMLKPSGGIDFGCHFYKEYPNHKDNTEGWIELEIRPWNTRHQRSSEDELQKSISEFLKDSRPSTPDERESLNKFIWSQFKQSPESGEQPPRLLAYLEGSASRNDEIEKLEAEIAALKVENERMRDGILPLQRIINSQSDEIDALKILKWISVQDELPSRGETVLVYSPELSEGYVFELMYFDNGKWSYSLSSDESTKFKITHWFNPTSLGVPETDNMNDK